MTQESKIHVSSEVGKLKRIIIHSPDEGIGKIIPTKAQDWLFEDIIHLETMRGKEYDLYVKLLLYFLDYDKIHGKMNAVDDPSKGRAFYKPSHKDYFNSDKVVELEFLLAEVLDDKDVRNRLVAAVCCQEKVPYKMQEELYELSSMDLARTLISGILPATKTMIFAPIPNFIFTRDIGIVVNEHILLNRPAKSARRREALLTKYIMYNHSMFDEYQDKILEIENSEDYFLLDREAQKLKRVTLEGGDVMTVAPNHLLIGCSERTSIHAVSKVIRLMFAEKVVEKVTVVKIPPQRAYMHIDTTFTQVKRNMWVIFGPFSKEGKRKDTEDFIQSLGENFEKITLNILQYTADTIDNPKRFEYLEDLLNNISAEDLKSTQPTEFIYSGDGKFPFGHREQWTDSCNVLAVKEGVVIGYDRNDRTARGFQKVGMKVVHAKDLLEQFDKGELHPDEVENTLILLPSAELSRARGGSHCISMPLWREDIFKK